MATAYQPTPRWEQSVPMSHENLPLASRTLFDPSYSYDASQAPREPSNYSLRRPSQPSATLDVDSYQMDHIKRDSARGVKKERSTSRNSSPQKRAAAHARRPSSSHGRPSAPVPIPHADSQPTLDPNPESSAWIHRDKLARIESQEMAAAGFDAPRSSYRRHNRSESRSASRSTSQNPNSRAQSANRQVPLTDETASPNIPAFEEYTTEGASQSQDSDDYEERLQEEPRVDRMYSRSLPRPTFSRIPIARASPAPVSQSVVERDSPLPRSMQGSASMSSRLGDSTTSRTRSRSLGSPTMMVEPGSTRSAIPSKPRPRSSHLQDSPSVTSSPSLSAASKSQSMNASTRAKATNASATNSMGRKTNPRNTPRSRNPSVSARDSPARRPTSGSNKPRPTSLHNRPEGEAPWIAHMYKPDPRLPPDQQMLPTHAKRTIQGQSESQRETDQTFPKDFNLLSDEELAKMGALPPPESAQAQAQTQTQNPDPLPSKQQNPNNLQSPWPLTSNKSDAKSQAESTQGAGSGYRTTPTIETPRSPQPPATQPAASRPTKPIVQRMPDPDEKEDGKKKKKLACCIVM